MATGAVSLDAADRRLLRIIQRDASRSAEEIGAQCGMSASTALRRLKRLRAAGVIRSEAAVLDPVKVGRPLLLIMGVRLEREDAAIIQNFLDRVIADPAVMQCYFVTGSSDYILHISARDMDEYEAFLRELISHPHVAMSETHVVIKAIKVSLSVPIED